MARFFSSLSLSSCAPSPSYPSRSVGPPQQTEQTSRKSARLSPSMWSQERLGSDGRSFLVPGTCFWQEEAELLLSAAFGLFYYFFLFRIRGIICGEDHLLIIYIIFILQINTCLGFSSSLPCCCILTALFCGGFRPVSAGIGSGLPGLRGTSRMNLVPGGCTVDVWTELALRMRRTGGLYLLLLCWLLGAHTSAHGERALRVRAYMWRYRFCWLVADRTHVILMRPGPENCFKVALTWWLRHYLGSLWVELALCWV